MAIKLVEDYAADRIDSATLPPFSNTSRCPRCRVTRWGTWVIYCPGCARIVGPHFHRECPCGEKWDER